MSYLQHFVFAMTLAIESSIMPLILIAHAIFPNIFINKFSNWIKSCEERIKG